jgi:AmmeMemoRadiSam system protein B
MGKSRATELAGSWYPGDAGSLRAQVKAWDNYIELKAGALKAPAGGKGSKSLALGVAPHAGWIYSGKLSAAVISAAGSSLGPGGPELVVVLGGHLPEGAPVVYYTEDSWDTPLSPLALSPDLNGAIAKGSPGLPLEAWDGPTGDNTVEVLLPLVKHYFPEARALALRVPPDGSALALWKALAPLLSPRKALVLASTDLTHYGEAYGFAPAGPGKAGMEFREKNDRAFIEATLALDCQALLDAANEGRAACSAGAVATVSALAKEAGLQGSLVDYYASSDVSGMDFLSVGYAGIVFPA